MGKQHRREQYNNTKIYFKSEPPNTMHLIQGDIRKDFDVGDKVVVYISVRQATPEVEDIELINIEHA